jgi:adenosylmethionine-8-amino-7-oxononanoate aminotransferase
MNDLLKTDRENIWHPFTPLIGAPEPLLIDRAEGVYLFTHDGRKIMDGISSWWVNLHGHAHPKIAQAIADQARKLEHVIFAGFTHEPAITLTKNLLSILPESFSKIFFSDNGSTAVEVALKMAMQYWHNQGISRKKIIAIDGAYHGDTFGSMSVGERSIFSKPFSPYLFEVTFIDFPTKEHEAKVVSQFKSYIDRGDVGIFIYEPLIQAAGGMRMYSADVLGQLIEYAQLHNVICIADEVFTGFGRTGKILASDYIPQKPDLMALSKGLTGGTMPLSVTAASSKIVSAFHHAEFSKTFFHGHSFTANPVSCAAANASFSLLNEPGCIKNIKWISDQHKIFSETIKNNPAIHDCRCLGTVLAIELKSEENSSYSNNLRKTIYSFFLNKDILLRPLGNTFYMVPPYCITQQQLVYVYDAIRDFLKQQ